MAVERRSPGTDVPRLSVCMPVFNGSRFLPRIFSSLAAQTFKDFELIVIDDGSADDSASQSAHLMTQHGIRGFVIRSTNRGAEQSRDLACAHARADIIAQLDCDDWWEPTYLEEMIGALRSQPDIDLVYCDLLEQFPEGHTILKSDIATWIDLSRAERHGDLYKFRRGEFFKMLLRGQVLFPPCTVYRRELYERAGRYAESLSGLRVSLDWAFGLRAGRMGTIAFLKRPLLHKLIHDTNVSGDVVATVGCTVEVLVSVLADSTLSREETRIARAYGAMIARWASYESWAVRRKHRQAIRWALTSLRFRWTWQAARLVALSLIPRSLVEHLRPLWSIGKTWLVRRGSRRLSAEEISDHVRHGDR